MRPPIAMAGIARWVAADSRDTVFVQRGKRGPLIPGPGASSGPLQETETSNRKGGGSDLCCTESSRDAYAMAPPARRWLRALAHVWRSRLASQVHYGLSLRAGPSTLPA